MIDPIARRFDASDGYPLHVLSWSPADPPRALAVILHGVQSHAGWYHHLGRTLAEAGIEAHFPDRRGSGANRKDRGHSPSHRRLVLDVVEFARDVRRHQAETPLVLGGISWGAKIAIVAAGREPELIDGLALICPGLEPRVGVSWPERIRIALAYFARARATFPIPLTDPDLFTSNPDAQRFIASDEHGLRSATAGLLAASMLLDRNARRSPPRVVQPCLLMLAGRDRIVDNDRTRAYFRRLASVDKDLIEYPEAHHTLEFEHDPGRYARDLISWIDARWADGRDASTPVLADGPGTDPSRSSA